MCATRDQQSFSLIEKITILYVFNLSNQFIKIKDHNSCDFAQRTGYLLTTQTWEKTLSQNDN